MLLRMHESFPAERHLRRVTEILNQGGVIIYPTDTVYGMGCDIYQPRAVDRVARIKGIKSSQADFSLICHDLSHVSGFTRPINNEVFKLMKAYLPGPYTFILHANSQVPKIFQSRKKTIGIRIPANKIIRKIVEELGHPVMTTSVHDDDSLIEYTTDPELIHEKYRKLVDVVIDGGYGKNEPSTIIDCTGAQPVITRQGIGEID